MTPLRGVTMPLESLPLALLLWLASVILLAGVRIRNRIDAAVFRLWVKRALFVIALGMLAQYAYSLLN